VRKHPLHAGYTGSHADDRGDGYRTSTLANGNGELLTMTLSAAVPLWIDRLKLRPLAEVLERARECGQFIAEHGDIILYKSSPAEVRKFGGTAEAFNRLAEGLAALSFCPGGVRFMELHFEAKHPESAS
jgi:hypothetical protein